MRSALSWVGINSTSTWAPLTNVLTSVTAEMNRSCHSPSGVIPNVVIMTSPTLLSEVSLR